MPDDIHYPTVPPRSEWQDYHNFSTYKIRNIPFRFHGTPEQVHRQAKETLSKEKEA